MDEEKNTKTKLHTVEHAEPEPQQSHSTIIENGQKFHQVVTAEVENERVIVTHYLVGVYPYTEYKFRDVCSPDLSRHELNTVENIQSALTALNKLHGHGVVHGDLKPEHIRSYQDRETGKVQACFVDFGLSGEQGAKSKGCTWEFASFERLLSDKMSTLSMIDDYEALFLCALIQIDPAWLPRPPQAETESRKNHLRAKLEFMGRISSCANQQNSILRWVCQKLMLVWQHPRALNVDEEVFSQLAHPSLVPFDIDALRAKVLAKFETVCELKELKEEDKEEKLPETPANAAKRAHGHMLKQALSRANVSGTWYSGVAKSAADNTHQAEKYHSLCVLKGVQQQNPSLWINPTQQTRFPTLTTLAGQVVYGEAGRGVTPIWCFLNNIDSLKMRPLEYLLLFAGIHVSPQEFTPVGNDSLAAADESQSEGLKQFTAALKADDALSALDADIERAGETTTNYLCVALATLIVAGRFFVENWSNIPQVVISQTYFHDVFKSAYSTTAENAILERTARDLTERNESLTRELEDLAMQLDYVRANPQKIVWALLDGVEFSFALSPAPIVQELLEELNVLIRVYPPSSDWTTCQPLNPSSFIPETSRIAPLLIFREK